jgi:hypothetical protein
MIYRDDAQTAMTLVDNKVFSNGIIVASYKPQ